MRKNRHVWNCFVVAVSFLFCPNARSAWQDIGRMTAGQPRGNQIEFHNASATAIVTVLAPDLVRVRIVRGTTPGPDYSWAVVKTDWPPVEPQISCDKVQCKISTSQLEVRIQLNPFRAAFYNPAGGLISKDDDALGTAWNGPAVRCSKSMPTNEHYFGLGEKAGPLDKRGRAYVMWNTDPTGYNALSDPMYESIPFFVGVRQGKAYGIFFDNTYRSVFDMGVAATDAYSFGADGGEMNYYFFYGPDTRKVITRFTELVGRTEMPPRWTLGYLQSAAHYYPAVVFNTLAQSLRQKHIPCDGIFFDTQHMDASRDFTWDKSGFPDPKKLLGELRDLGFHAFAIVDPGVKQDPGYYVYDQGLAGGHFLKRTNGELYVAQIWPGASVFPDFTSATARAWWASEAAGFAKVGFSGFLTDMNEPTVDAMPIKQGWIPAPFDPDVTYDDHGLHTADAKNHNVYGLLMSEATREGLLQAYPNERPFVVTRATYAGGQRYAAQWTGDNIATWEDLRASLRLIQSMGVSGLVFTGSDVGGFVNVPDAELYTRWLQAGVFHPFFETHSVEKSHAVDPFSFGPQFEDANRRAIELRYRLLPYLYTAFYQATQTGIPIARTLPLEFPDDPRVFNETPSKELNEFMFGDDLLVAPVVNPGERSRNVYLPKGVWFDFAGDRAYTGPASVTVDAPLDTIPVFVRGGAIIPMQQVVQYTGEAPINPLTFEIYPEGSSSREYYEDDGASLNYKHGEFLHERISASDTQSVLTIKRIDVSGSYTPPSRSLMLKIHGGRGSVKAVTLDGRQLPTASSIVALADASAGVAYDEDHRVLCIKFADTNAPFEVDIQK